MGTSTARRQLRDKLFEDVRLKSELSVEGFTFDPKIFADLPLGTVYQEQVHRLFENDHEDHANLLLPCGFTNPNGVHFGFKWIRRSPFDIVRDGNTYILRRKGRELFPIEFERRPKHYDLKGSSGQSFLTVGGYSRGDILGSSLNVAYSNECALKDKGLDCLFCNANATAANLGSREGVGWKNPLIIAESLKAAWELDGVRHFNLTGGFVPEHREIDYYLDVAEKIVEVTGLEDFNGTAVIGAPLDYGIIDKYAESPFRTLAINMEVWNEHYFEVIVPGKSQLLGGRKNWIGALEYAVRKFGPGRVRSGFVAGIEPKKYTLEGVEYLTSLGIISGSSGWNAGPGSALEGHRTPEPEWHWDFQLRVHEIQKRAGFNYETCFNNYPSPNFVGADLHAIDEELFPIQQELLQTAGVSETV